MRMTYRQLKSGVWTVYGFVVFTVFLSVADQQLGKQRIIPIPPTSLALLCLLPFVVNVFLRAVAFRDVSTLIAPIKRNWLPLSFFGVLAFSSLLLSMMPDAFWGDGGKWIFLISYGFIICVAAIFVPSQGSVRASLTLYAFCALCLLLYSMWIDIEYPGTYSTVVARAAGFPGNSNFAALVTVMLCASFLDYDSSRPRWINFTFLTVSLLAVVATMSRSGMMNLAALFLFYFYFQYVHSGVKLRKIGELVVLGVGLVGFVVFVLPLMSNDVSIDGKQNKTRLSRLLQNEQVDDGSTETRLNAVKDSIRLIDESPILGHGTAHARTMDELPHNLYLAQWINNGLLGLLGYIGLLVAAMYSFTIRRYRAGQAFIVVSLIGSFFSHNILEQRPFLMLFGIHLGLSTLSPATVSSRERNVSDAS